MPVQCVVTDHQSGLLATLTGGLTLADTVQLRVRLFKCLAEQPDALLIDLSGLSVEEPLALTVFAAVNRQAARWPGVPVLLCAPSDQVAGLLAVGPGRMLPVFATVPAAAARAHVHRTSMRSLSDEFLPVAGAARQARDLATEACLRWELPGLIGPAALIAGELVGNVVDHASTMATLRLNLRPRFLTIAVHDGSSAAPLFPGPGTRGRGLMLVRESAHSWGWLPAEAGKVVWASLRAADGAGRRG
jgi:anti-anti-sigma regulatory factor